MRCKRCNKILVGKNGRRVNPKRKFCNQSCRVRYNGKQDYYKNRDNPEYQDRKREELRRWYKKNKERHNTNVMNDYHKNKAKWNERKFTQKHRKIILEFLNKKCVCGKDVKVIHHKEYGYQPKLSMGKKKEDEGNRLLLKEYVKHLKGYCSSKCHREIERK